jgi:hypothetical protein
MMRLAFIQTPFQMIAFPESDDEIETVAAARPAAAPSYSILKRPRPISDELCAFFDIPNGSLLSRTQVTNRIYKYVTENGLLEGQTITLDEKLANLLGAEIGSTIPILTIHQSLKKHYIGGKLSTG